MPRSGNLPENFVAPVWAAHNVTFRFRKPGFSSQLLIVAGLAALAGCTEKLPTDPPQRAAAVSAGFLIITPSPANVAIGATVQLRATRDSSGVQVPVQAFWWSKNKLVAKVSSTGLVTGVSTGVTQIGAEIPGGIFTLDSVKVGNVAPPPPTGGIPISSTLLPILKSYVGGLDADAIRDVGADAQGNIYLAGSTASTNFPVTINAFDRTFNSTSPKRHDGFIVKLTPGGQVAWSTYLGSPGFDRIYALEVDAQGFVYVAGRAGPGFPVTLGAFQTTFMGGDAGALYGLQDGFVCKFRPDGTRVFCSYFGDTDVNPVRDIAVDGTGNIYVASSSSTGTFPASWFVNGFQKTRRGGLDLVIAKIKTDGTQVLWATYLGGSGAETPTPSVRVDAAGNVYAFSTTKSLDAPTPNGLYRTLRGQSDAYIAKLAPSGSTLLWATYLGGSRAELTETHSIAVDPTNGDVIVAAGTLSENFPRTIGAFQNAFGGAGSTGSGSGTNYPGDAFVTRIAANGSRIVGSTYLGGAAGDGAEGVWVDQSGAVYVSGTSFSSNFPQTNPLSGLLGKGDFFVTKLWPDLSRVSYSGRFGGAGFDVARGLFVSPAGVAYVVGEMASSNFTLLSPFQSAFGGTLDGGFLKLLPN